MHAFEEIVTGEYKDEDITLMTRVEDVTGKPLLHCVQRMPFRACQNGGNHWYLIFIKYHHDTSNCILKMFLKKTIHFV